MKMIEDRLTTLSQTIPEIQPPFNIKETKFGYFKVTTNDGSKGKVELGKNRKGQDTLKFYFGKHTGIIIMD